MRGAWFVLLLVGLFAHGDVTPHDLSYVQVPVSFFPLGNRPTMEIEIEGRRVPVLIDSGCGRALVLQEEVIAGLQQKEWAAVSDFVGIQGNVYHTHGVRVPEIKIGHAIMQNVVLAVDRFDALADSSLWPRLPILDWCRDQLEWMTIHGKIGGPAFRGMICLFDFPHSRLILAHELSALIRGMGCSLEGFTAVPFTIERCGVVLAVETEFGLKKLVLDTGATHSFLRKSEIGPEVTVTGWFRPRVETRALRMGGDDFGGWRFWLFDFSDAFLCDGMLGVDFFKKHEICLDFPNHMAYIK